MPLVQLSLRAGRDAATKRRLIAELTDAVVRVTGVEAERVRVLLYELPDEHWGVGGVPAGEAKS